MLTLLVFTLTGTAGPPAKGAFGFNSRNVSGFPTGAAEITGGGAYELASGFVNSAGGFRCNADIQQGPLTGCLAGQGIRRRRYCLRPLLSAPVRLLSR